MRIAVELCVALVALYPICTASLWMAGAVLFRLVDEGSPSKPAERQWRGVTVLIPAYNEEQLIGECVAASLAVDYPELEVIVLDDGSTDGTERAALAASRGDPRCRVIRDAVNRGKADRLNFGFRCARYDLVAITDADTHIHPLALKFLVARISRSPMLAAVAAAPHVTNRGRLLVAMQVLEAAAVISLVRRTHSLTGRVGVVAGVLGLFRRERVLGVGGFDPRMATEDIDLSWRLVLAGWHTAYEPRAIVGMHVPTSARSLWQQRTRWARGQGEVLHVHLRDVRRRRNHRVWLLGIEALASLVWVAVVAASLAVTATAFVLGGVHGAFDEAVAWGIAIAVIATIQMIVALSLERRYDPTNTRAFALGAVYPIAYWLISASAALHSQLTALIRGPRAGRVVWDIARERIEAPSPGKRGAG
jgi:poly-beta-1,6-N-acetyl-D-glucosamine synthase